MWNDGKEWNGFFRYGKDGMDEPCEDDVLKFFMTENNTWRCGEPDNYFRGRNKKWKVVGLGECWISTCNYRREFLELCGKNKNKMKFYLRRWWCGFIDGYEEGVSG